MVYSIKNVDEWKDLDELDDRQSKVKQVRLVEKLGKQGFHYDLNEQFEPIRKTLTDISQRLLEESQSTGKEFVDLNESNE